MSPCRRSIFKTSFRDQLKSLFIFVGYVYVPRVSRYAGSIDNREETKCKVRVAYPFVSFLLSLTDEFYLVDYPIPWRQERDLDRSGSFLLKSRLRSFVGSGLVPFGWKRRLQSFRSLWTGAPPRWALYASSHGNSTPCRALSSSKQSTSARSQPRDERCRSRLNSSHLARLAQTRL